MKRKIFYVILITVILALLSLGGIGLYQYLRIKYAKIEVTLIEDLTIPFNETRKLSDYIVSINGELIEDETLHFTTLGEKKIRLNFINDDDIKVKYDFTLTVTDVTAPYIRLGETYSKTLHSADDLLERIICVDDIDENPTCKIEGTYDLTKEGNYNLTFIATDASGNKSEQPFKLTVYEQTNTSNYEPTYTYYKDIIKYHKTNNTKIGLDLSTWQGSPDFKTLKEEGVEFVILRIGSTKGENDEYFLDDEFIRNITEANKYDIPVGIYFYSYADSIEKAKENANWILEQIKDYEVELGIAFDWENWTNFNSYNLSLYELNEMANVFINTVETSGYNAMLYGSKSYLEDMWNTENKTIWVAQYLSDITEQTTYKGKYKIWQMCSDGIIEGINGYVDINIMYEGEL